MVRIYFYFVLQPGILYAFAQETPGDPNIIIITIDGLSWQEIFNGADKNIIADEKYLDDVQLTQDSWRNAKQKPGISKTDSGHHCWFFRGRIYT